MSSQAFPTACDGAGCDRLREGLAGPSWGVLLHGNPLRHAAEDAAQVFKRLANLEAVTRDLQLA